MHIILNDRGQVAAFGGRDLVPGHDQALVPVLSTELARAEGTAAALPQAGGDFLAVVQARAVASVAAGHDLPALDRAVGDRLAALTTAQLDAAQAEERYNAAGVALRDALTAASLEATQAHGEHGVVIWDADRKQFVAALDERRRAAAAAQAEADAAALAAARAVVAKAKENPDFALLARLLGVDTSDEAAVAAAFAARRQG